MAESSNFISYKKTTYSNQEMAQRSNNYFKWLNGRRSLRSFSDKPVDREVIENIIKCASTAPSGAHKQPWTFCVVGDSTIKTAIRKAAEEEEYISYNGRMTAEWLKDLQPFRTDWNKPFLEIAPWLIIVFKKTYDFDEKGEKSKNYYVNESVGIATGFLLTAIHNAGLAALTHTPSPMNFLQKILERPKNEKPFLLIPVGYPTDNATVPKLKRKPLDDIAKFY